MPLPSQMHASVLQEFGLRETWATYLALCEKMLWEVRQLSAASILQLPSMVLPLLWPKWSEAG